MRFSLPIAIYFDLENIDKNFNLSKLMESVVLEANSDGNRDENAISPLIAIKLACGETNSIAKFRSQLTDMNFEIREVPHVVQKKNRSDLVLCCIEHQSGGTYRTVQYAQQKECQIINLA